MLFSSDNCQGTITQNGKFNFLIQGTCKGASKGNYAAASPPDFRQSYSGSGLPFANREMAMCNSPNVGVIGGTFSFEVIFPNSYYINNGSKLVTPEVCIDFDTNEHVVVKLGNGLLVQHRSLSNLPECENRSTGR